ncbi:MAG: XRE family transcriptional regulator [Cytophagales bacterium]|nr:MAG: XRE family transcriptional regulator [Cytophagales bacterium]
MDIDINLRINQLIVKLGFNKSTFAVKIGVSQPVITHITSGRNNPGLEVIQKILLNCPETNPEWLILGKGEMILNNKLKEQILKDLKSDIYNSILILKKELKLLDEKFEILKHL